jgi:hypothetical protein
MNPRSKWILKAPFTTNSKYYKYYVNDAFSGINRMNAVVRDQTRTKPNCYIIPYMIFQERVTNNKEVKMIFLNRKFSHFVSPSARSSLITTSLQGFENVDLIRFGNEVVARLDEDVYETRGLFRVDIFKSNHGNLVVNELESLDANYYSSNELIEPRVISFLENYWETLIHNSITNIMQRNLI